MRLVLAAGLILAGTSAMAADSVKVTVGHMCCGACKASATNGLKGVTWADTVAIDGDAITVTAKAGQKIELVSLTDALNKCGFPAREITASGPVTMTLAHLCCGGCVNALKEKVAAFRGNTLDKDNVKIDLATRSVTFQPAAGQNINVAGLIRQLQTAGVYPTSCTMVVAAAAASR